MTSIIQRVGCVVAAFFLLAAAHAQTAWEFPSKRVTFVVPFTPGGAGDLIARALAPRLAVLWGQPVVIENRPGAGGNTGSKSVAIAPPDGHTIMIGSTSSHAINTSLYRERMPYDVLKDFSHVVMVANSPHILLLNPAVPASNMAELIAYARAHPGKLNFSSGGIGTSTHLAGELLNSMAGLTMVHVPYRGAPEAVAGVIAGDTQLMFENLTGALAQLRSGRLRGVAISSLKRSPQAPELAPLSDAVPGFETGVWFGIFVPSATPPAVVTRINSDINAVMRSREVRDHLEKLGMSPMGGTTEEAQRFVRDEIAKWAKVVTASGAKAD
jgi:tripartite-type tricarboxylate transporter receptor subunit TctC